MTPASARPVSLDAGPLDRRRPDDSVAAIYLHPGQVFVSGEPSRVTTILGSCVAVCMWDPVSRAGGINHFLLPHWAGEGHSSARFGNVAMQSLVERLTMAGARTGRLKAKLFGGASVLEAFRTQGHLGSRNVELAERLLAEYRIEVVARDVGGSRGRKLVFETGDGTAWVRQLG
jgi:chemotaxis protein CheD